MKPVLLSFQAAVSLAWKNILHNFVLSYLSKISKRPLERTRKRPLMHILVRKLKLESCNYKPDCHHKKPNLLLKFEHDKNKLGKSLKLDCDKFIKNKP
jgi:hypothetical protein